MQLANARNADPSKLIEGELLISPDEMDWIPTGPRMKTKILRIDEHNGSWVQLDHYEAGGTVKKHLHKAPIEWWMVRGSFQYRGDRIVQQGSYVYEPLGAIHAEAHAPEEAEILAIIHGPIEFLDDDNNTVGVIDWESVARTVAEANPTFDWMSEKSAVA